MTTAKGMPEISVNQANKYVTINESLNMIDGLLLLVIQDRNLMDPPASPIEGTCYIPAATATGAWAGHEGDIAHYYNETWYFYKPWYGWLAYVADENSLIYWNNTSWVYLSLTLAGFKMSVASSWFASLSVPDAPELTSDDMINNTAQDPTSDNSVVPYNGDWETIDMNFSTVVEEYNALRSDVSNIRLQLNDLLAKLRVTGGVGILDDVET